MAKKKFLRYQVELVGTNDTNDLTETLVTKLNNNFEKKEGLYDLKYGRDPIQICAHSERNTIILTGTIKAETKAGCKGLYAELKAEAKQFFPSCKRTQDLMVAEGDNLY